MKYDFFSEMAVNIHDERNIDRSIEALKPAPWSVKAAVLSTGLGQDDDFDSQIKNGQKEDHKKGKIGIGGYPSIFLPQKNCGLPQEWHEFFTLQEKNLQHCPDFSCLIEIDLELVRPFYSRDDRAFYPIENPIKRDWVFHEPYLAAAGIKGLLRWAWDMCWSDDKSKSDLAGKLFGPEKEKLTEENAQMGMLYPGPLFWNGRV